MEERNIAVDRENGGSLATFSLIAVVVVALLIGLFVWQPWNSTSGNATTTVNRTSNTGTTSGSSTTTTTTTNTNSGGTH